MAGMHKILKIYTETKLDGKHIDINTDPIDILQMAEDDKNLYRFRKDVHFCCYKTVFENIESILMIFTIKLPNTTTGSSASSEKVMDIVELLEDLLSPINDYRFFRNIEGVNKNIAVLKIVKHIENNNL